MDETQAQLAAAGAIALWAAAVTPSLVQHDLREFRLPNRLTLPGWWVAAGALAVVTPLTGQFPTSAALTALILLVVLVAVALTGGLGMGDVKLVLPLAVGLLLVHPQTALVAAMLALCSGAIVALGTVIQQRNLRAHIPFGPPILLGYWTGYTWSATGILPGILP